MTETNNGQGEYAGQGGSYRIDAVGDHVLVERTRNPGDEPGPTDPPAPADVATQDQPAAAGFFSPDASAEQPTTTE